MFSQEYIKKMKPKPFKRWFSNSTDLDDGFLKNMTKWIAKEVGIKKEWLKKAEFRYTRDRRYFSGLADHAGWITVRIGDTNSEYPYLMKKGHVECLLSDRIAALINVTAHEIQHVKCFRECTSLQLQRDRDLEPYCERTGKRVLLKFESMREELLTKWNRSRKPIPITVPAEPVQQIEPQEVPQVMAAKRAPVLTLQQRRAAKVKLQLTRWERRLKLAKAKVKKYTGKVNYYAKKGAI